MGFLKSKVFRAKSDTTIACVHCGTTKGLKMIPHRDRKEYIVGWLFTCYNCVDLMVDKTVAIGEPKTFEDYWK